MFIEDQDILSGSEGLHYNDAILREAIIEHAQISNIYESATRSITTRLETLNNEFRTNHRHNPIHHIQSRVKTPQSALRKLKERGLPLTMSCAKKMLHDMAGVRVVCYYVEDIYTIARLLLTQDDIQQIEEKDYIKSPKSNGYRSLHLVVDVPVYLSSAKIYTPVEIQIRTVAMDFWASLEHNLKYKASNEVPQFIVDELKECADVITRTDAKMEQIYKALNLLRDAPQEFQWQPRKKTDGNIVERKKASR